MKKTIAVSLMLISLSAFAERNDSDGPFFNDLGLQTTEEGIVLAGLYTGKCNHYYNIGYSTVFGEYDDYEKPFKSLGWFSSELENTKGISSSDTKFHKAAFKDAYEFQMTAYRSIAQITLGQMRNAQILEDDPYLKDTFSGKLDGHRETIKGQVRYNTKKTFKDIEDKLSYVPPRSGDDTVDVVTSWDEYQTCKIWWGFEEKNLEILYAEFPEVYEDLK